MLAYYISRSMIVVSNYANRQICNKYISNCIVYFVESLCIRKFGTNLEHLRKNEKKVEHAVLCRFMLAGTLETVWVDC